MAERLYKDNANIYVLDDRHQIFGMYSSQCAFCKHFVRYDYYCAAFEDGIPDEILSGELKHNDILPNQTNNNITFTPK